MAPYWQTKCPGGPFEKSPSIANKHKAPFGVFDNGPALVQYDMGHSASITGKGSAKYFIFTTMRMVELTPGNTVGSFRR